MHQILVVLIGMWHATDLEINADKKKLTDLETKFFLQQWSRTGLCSYQESNYVFVKSSKLLWAPDFLVKRMKLDLWKICCKLEFHQRWSRVWLDKFHIEMRYATFPIKRDESPGPDECDAAFCGKNRGVVGSNTVHAVQFYLFIYHYWVTSTGLECHSSHFDAKNWMTFIYEGL